MTQRRGFLVILFLTTFVWLAHLSGTSSAQPPATVNPPVGTVMAWAGPVNTIPSNWLLCDGRRLDRTRPENVALFNAIGTSWGGDATTFFNIPDLSGRFLRGVDKFIDVNNGNALKETTPARDPDRGSRLPAKPGGHGGNDVGTLQDDMFQNHKHDLGVSNPFTLFKTEDERVDNDDEQGAHVNGNEGNHDPGTVSVTMGEPIAPSAGAALPRFGEESRPRNAYVYWVIRVR